MKYERAFSTDPLSEDQTLLRLIDSPRRLLEVGCSAGYFSCELVRRGIDVTAVDIDPESVALASSRGISARQIDIEDLELIGALGGPFDLVLMSNVLEHLRRPIEVLGALREVVEPDGRFVISVPNVAHVSVRRSLLAGRFDYTRTGIMDTTHVRFYTRSTLRSIIQEAGLRVTREASSPGLLTPTLKGLVIRRLARRMPGLLAVHLIAEARPC